MPKKTKQNERFIDNGDNTILDMETGLMWAKEGSEKYMNFKEAEAYCKDLSLGGHKDWRLPTRKELLSIVDDTRYNPAIDPVFKCLSDWYWTSTKFAEDSDYQWIVDFGSGSSDWHDRSSSGDVRPVRQYKLENSVINKSKTK